MPPEKEATIAAATAAARSRVGEVGGSDGDERLLCDVKPVRGVSAEEGGRRIRMIMTGGRTRTDRQTDLGSR